MMTTTTDQPPTEEENITLTHPTLILLQEKCKHRGHLKQILAQMFRTKMVGPTFPTSRLIHTAATSLPSTCLDIATALFQHFTPTPNLFIFNTLISSLSSLNSPSSCFSLYTSLLSSPFPPNHTTLLSLLRCSPSFSSTRQVHTHSFSLGLSSHPLLHNSFLRIHLHHNPSLSSFKNYQTLLPPAPDLVSFNILILWSAKRNLPALSLSFFRRLLASGLSPDRHTLAGVLLAAGRLGSPRLGAAVHGWCTRRLLLHHHSSLCNPLIDMYNRCGERGRAGRVFEGAEGRDGVSWNIAVAGCVREGDMGRAERYFRRMPERDLVSWNTMMAGYVRGGDVRRVWGLFAEMGREGVAGDGFTAVSLAAAAAEGGEVEAGRRVHGWIVRRGIEEDVHVVSAMVSMYCRCGSVARGEAVFRAAAERDVGVWTAMIAGRGRNGEGEEAVRLLGEMRREGVDANRITYVAALGACSRGGMVEEGMGIFKEMERDEVGVEHYGCVVDMLGRAGRVKEAAEVAEGMGDRATAAVWGAVLGAAGAQGETEVGERAMRGLERVESGEEGGFVAMANAYSSCGRWAAAKGVREALDRGTKREKKMMMMKKKKAGVSSVAVVEFLE